MLDKKEAKIVKEIYNMRLEYKAYSTIAYILEEKYGRTIDFKFRANRVQQLVHNKFYYGVIKWA